jgi:exodeoxyribonuclease VII large subunit
MQGAEAVPSILKALDCIFQEEDKFDAVAIIRGGGAQADLGCFDNFELAWAVAQFPLPVITGIGHEKDDTVIDLVAHTRMKTPTAAAGFFISGVAVAYEKILTLQVEAVKESRDALNKLAANLNSLAASVSHSSKMYLQSANTRTERIAQRFRNSAGKYLAAKSELLFLYKSQLSKESKFVIYKHQNQLYQVSREIRFLAKTSLSREQQRLRQLRDLAPSVIRTYQHIREMKLASSEAVLRLLDPQNVLNRGFTLTMQKNRIIKSVKELSESHNLETRFFDGQVTSRIIKEQ